MILVTGASGLVGSHLIPLLLNSGGRVRALYHTGKPQLVHENIEWVQCDILDVIELEEVFEGIMQVYHCAAIVSFDPKEKQQLYQTNVEGTTNVVNACLDANITKLVYVSSVAALGRMKKQEPITEKMNWSKDDGSSVYAKTKYLAEMEVWRGIGEGLNAVIVNPTIILGNADWSKGSAGIFKSAFDEFAWYTEGTTGFVDVADVVDVMQQLMNSNITNQRFIVNGHNIGYRQLFTLIAKTFGKRPPYKKVTPFLAAVIWRIEALKGIFTGSKPLLTKETAHTAQAKIVYDNSKLLQQLPAFTYTPIEKTVERICGELRERYGV